MRVKILKRSFAGAEFAPDVRVLKVGGQFLAMKSVDTDDEIQRARSAIAQLGGKIGKIWDYTIPGTDVRHRVVIIRKERPTPAAYPRPFARIKKAPLG